VRETAERPKKVQLRQDGGPGNCVAGPGHAALAQRNSLVQREDVSRAPGAWETPGHGWTEDTTRGEPGITPG